MWCKNKRVERKVRKEVGKFLDSVTEMIFLCEQRNSIVGDSNVVRTSILYKSINLKDEVIKNFVYGTYGKQMVEYWIKQCNSLMQSGVILWLSKEEITNLETIPVREMCRYLTDEQCENYNLQEILEMAKKAVEVLTLCRRKISHNYQILTSKEEKVSIVYMHNNIDLNNNNEINFLIFKNNASEHLCRKLKYRFTTDVDEYATMKYWVHKYLQFDKHGLANLRALAKGGAFSEYAPVIISLLALSVSIYATMKPFQLSDGELLFWSILGGILALTIIWGIGMLAYLLLPLEKKRRYILEACDEIEKEI